MQNYNSPRKEISDFFRGSELKIDIKLKKIILNLKL